MEAHGLIAEMLADPYVPAHIVSGLRAVATLLAPPTPLSPNGSGHGGGRGSRRSSSNAHRNNANSATRISISLADFAHSESDSEENPYLGERTSNMNSKVSSFKIFIFFVTFVED